MEFSPVIGTLLSFLVVGILIGGWRILDWVWLKPKRLERCLRKQGLRGNSYRFLSGDIKESSDMSKQARSKPMPLSDDIAQYVSPFLHQTVKNYGKNSFVWIGPRPRVTIMEPEQIREIFTKFNDFQKPRSYPVGNLLVCGLANLQGEEWAKHRNIINPAFHQDKLKNMLPAFYQSCIEMISKWEKMVFVEGSSELDVWPYLINLTRDVISRAAFGSSYEEGRRIFQLLDDQINLTMQVIQSVYIPGSWFLPTKTNRKLKVIVKDIKDLLKEMIKKREKAIKAGEASKDDLLGILVESNIKEIQEHGDHKNMGMSIEDVIEDCKLFYFAGQETTSILLVWTMILLARHPHWQTKARAEVSQVFGDSKPDSNGMNRLKVVTMILYEVLRLYPAAIALTRSVPKETKLGKMLLPAGVEISLPVLLIHHDQELWGKDAHEFNPDRFSEGVSKPTKSQVIYFPFGWGPRMCIGMNFALMEAKMALAMILRQFWLEISPSYAHSPCIFLTLRPQHGAHLILHKL
ncbi:Cytochrome P450, family 72, subfamily A, polypeptide 15, putative [Theobroma cacao]|uniref:Cytochrome P450, family 72, subfamily A, polypeptide 15, putative n=1 Tax=Theobroma cacao TaxID=3641 RepID=A0A061FGP4_THECC|nr:Cytochrome P450, family 72, subfamily A, polypeptide 15, putative [Theobroma cacao]